MGILRLTSFMDENPQILKEFQLHDTKLVIDGKNLLHLIFEGSKINKKHGGDYDRFACEIVKFFSILKACNIKPYVLFDGGDDPSDRKFNTKLRGLRERLEKAMRISSGQSKKNNVMPILAYDTFKSVLFEINVPFNVCDFEADEEIAILANEFNCPVLSLDSDFYILPINAGYIPFNSVCLEPQEGKRWNNSVYHYLPARIYYVDSFATCFHALGRNVLPLIALLLGNDYVDREIFYPFFSSLRFCKYQQQFNIPDFFPNMRKLISWLNSLDTYDEGIQKILSSACTSEDKETILSAINITEKAYTLDNKSLSTEKILQISNNGLTVPSWVLNFHREGRLPSELIKILLSRRNFLKPQIEDLKSPSSYQCCARLRKYVYCILLSEDVGNAGVQSSLDNGTEANGKCAVEEYDRKGYELVKKVVCPIKNAKIFDMLPKLSEIHTLPPTVRENTVRLALDIPLFNIFHLSKDLEFILGIVLFWKKNAQPNATENHLRSVLVCLIMLKLTSIVRRGSTGHEQNLIDDAVLGMPVKARKQINMRLLMFSQIRDDRLDSNLIHGFAQLQACFKTAMDLNCLLLCPFPTPCIYQIFSGTFLYNFVVELWKRRNPDMFVCELLSKNSDLPKVYEILYSAVMNSLL